MICMRQSNYPRGGHSAFECLRLCPVGGLVIGLECRTRSGVAILYTQIDQAGSNLVLVENFR